MLKRSDLYERYTPHFPHKDHFPRIVSLPRMSTEPECVP